MPASAPTGRRSMLSLRSSTRRVAPRFTGRRPAAHRRPGASCCGGGKPSARRRGDGDAHRPAGALDLRPVRHRQADRGRCGQFRSLAEPWADTATSTGRLIIAVLGGLADVERDVTRAAEGRSRTKARWQHMGRPPKLTPRQQKEARRRRAEGETLKQLAKSYNVGKSTISRLG
jgi:Helix-turn-helix domain of resolvase